MERIFTWDEAKRLGNIEKHHIDFAELPTVWDHRIEHGPSDQNGEHRWVALMAHRDSVITVIYTLRDGAIRIISARKA